MSMQNGFLKVKKVHDMTDVQITSLFTSQIRHKHAFVLQFVKSRLKYAGLRHLRRTLSKTYHSCPETLPVNDVRSRASTLTLVLLQTPKYAVSHQRPKERKIDCLKVSLLCFAANTC